MGEFMCQTCMKCVIIFFNVLALLGSFAMINLGAIVIWNKPLLQSILSPFLRSLGQGPIALTEKQVQGITSEFHKLLAPLGWPAFIFGIFIFIAAILAFVGICCPNINVLIAYAVFLGILIIIPLLIIIIYVANRQTMMVSAATFLRNHMSEYKSISSNTTSSILMGVVMFAFECCGFENGQDFKNWDMWHNDTFNGKTICGLDYPVPCCKPGMPVDITTPVIPTVSPNGRLRASQPKPRRIIMPSHAFHITVVEPGQKCPPDIPVNVGDFCPAKFTPENSYVEVGCKKLLDHQLAALADVVACSALIPFFINIVLLTLTILLIINYKQLILP